MEEELYKIIEEFPNYDINANGEVYNRKTNFRLVGTINKGYVRFRIPNKDKKIKGIYLHRLVALTFLENQNNYQEVDHIDGNKLNNNVSNLRWCSSSENNTNKENYSHKIEGRPEKRFKYVYWNEEKKKWYGCIRINGKLKYIDSGENDEEIYIKCLQYLVNINKDNEFLSQRIQSDIIKYNIL